MITTGSKYLIGVTAASLVGTVIYAIATEWGALGTVGLLSALVALGFLAGIALFVRDGDVSANDTAAHETSGAAVRAPGASGWPALVGVGLAVTAVGMVTLPAIFKLGVVICLAAGAEWLVQGWSERASADAAFNGKVRGRLAYPLELPIFATFLLGVIVYGFSRLMLVVSKESGPILFGIAGAIVLLFGALIARRPNLSKGFVATLVSIGLVGMAAGGVATALAGERSELTEAFEEDHFSLEHRTCDAEEHEFDEKASQSLANKANVAATVTLTDAGLVATQVGMPGELTSLTLQRSNPSTIIFKNETSEHRRLNAELDVVAIEGTDAVEQRILCTSLVEEGGTQAFTFTIGLPSFASETPYRFVVPGVEGTELLIEVP